MILKDRVKEELYRSLNVFNEAKNIKNSWIVACVIETDLFSIFVRFQKQDG